MQKYFGGIKVVNLEDLPDDSRLSGNQLKISNYYRYV